MRTYFANAVRDDGETEIEVEYTATPIIPATGPTYDCGGQPAEGGEVEIIKAWLCVESGLVNLNLVDLTDEEVDRITNEIAENLPEDDEPDEDYWRD